MDFTSYPHVIIESVSGQQHEVSFIIERWTQIWHFENKHTKTGNPNVIHSNKE